MGRAAIPARARTTRSDEMRHRLDSRRLALAATWITLSAFAFIGLPFATLPQATPSFASGAGDSFLFVYNQRSCPNLSIITAGYVPVSICVMWYFNI
jgi:hypothetical protein